MQAAHLAVTQQQMEVCTAGCCYSLLLLSGKVLHGVVFESRLLIWGLLRGALQSQCQLAKGAQLLWQGCCVLIDWRVVVPGTRFAVCESRWCGLHRAQLL